MPGPLPKARFRPFSGRAILNTGGTLHCNPRTAFVLTSEQAREWRRLGDPLAALVVSPARRDWILERYPYSDQGRPGILCAEQRTHKEVRAADRDVPVGTVSDAGEPLCTTFEFDGDEEALVEEGKVLAVAAD
jgi:hypothetical protein